MQKNIFLPLALLAALLTGCEIMQNKPSEQPAIQESVASKPTGSFIEPSEGILEYCNRFMAFSRTAQKEELAAINQRLTQNKQDLNDRTKAAIIYLLADAPEVRDTTRAQNLLDDLAREHDPDIERKTLVKILHNFLIEQNRLSRENSRLSLKMHDEQKRADALQQKLEELKKIEKNIVDRKVLDK